jgi:putative aldouronate transport system substrate-binding protein
MTAKAFMPFIYTPAYFGLALDDNRKVIEQYKDPLFREALKYLNLWYKEGLILENSFTMTADQMRSLVQNPDPLVAIIPAANGQGFTRIGTQRWIEQINLEPLKGPDGAQWAGQRDPWSNYFMGWIITDKCKDPELVIALYNWMLNDEVALDGYIGPKGQSWDDSIPGTKAINGSVPFFRLLVPFGSQAINCSWNNEEPIYSPKGRFNYGQQGTAYDMAVQWITSGYPAVMDKLLNDGSYNETKNYLHAVQDSKYSVPIKYFIPPLVISETDNARRSDINAVLDLYKTQAFVAFITGTKNINSNADWNTYLADLDRMGSKELAALLQKYIK